jgi:hypothetical protein
MQTLPPLLLATPTQNCVDTWLVCACATPQPPEKSAAHSLCCRHLPGHATRTHARPRVAACTWCSLAAPEALQLRASPAVPSQHHECVHAPNSAAWHSAVQQCAPCRAPSRTCARCRGATPATPRHAMHIEGCLGRLPAASLTCPTPATVPSRDTPRYITVATRPLGPRVWVMARGATAHAAAVYNVQSQLTHASTALRPQQPSHWWVARASTRPHTGMHAPSLMGRGVRCNNAAAATHGP